MATVTPASPTANTTAAISKVYENFSRKNTVTPGNKNRGGFDYIINSMMLISIVGMCVKIFFSTEPTADGKSGPANAVIYGYGIVALAILTVLFISYGIHDRINTIENRGKQSGIKGKLANIIGFLKSFLTSSGPSILTIAVLGWIITLNISYYTKINKGAVANEFYQLSTGTTYLFVFQIICLFQYLKLFIEAKMDKKKEAANMQAQSRIGFATYFITTINLIIVGMMTIILQFFSTDG
jgi:hypothetical protein